MNTLTMLRNEFGGRLVAGSGDADPVLSSVALDSRLAQEGALFAALPGASSDGVAFLRDALGRGARAALLSPLAAERVALKGIRAPLWIHEEARRTAGRVAARLAGSPTHDLHVVAVTGTNGKTSVAHGAAQLLAAGGRSVAELGTVGYELAGGVRHEATHTTPDAPRLQALFAEHRSLGGDAVVLEASSHALDQERLAGTDLDVAVFTNCTRDHLDYHADMASYLASKRRLFEALDACGTAVVNTRDPHAGTMAEAARERGARVVTFAATTDRATNGAGADLRATECRVEADGTGFILEGMGIPAISIRLPLFGLHNVENALASTAAALVSGVSSSIAVEELTRIQPAPGRLEEVGRGKREFTVLVDYAHTEDALARVLGSLRAVLDARGGGRLVCVFGCGGDRDAGKRAAMGRAVAELADAVVVTSDNPRSETPEGIVREVVDGVVSVRRSGTDVVSEVDRRAAIERAFGLARQRDIVLIAGKGHEATQEVAGELLPFDDRRVAEELLV